MQVQRALRLGATGIMLDASVWPLEENISRTAAAVAVCHACGVPVEGELGHVSGGQDEKMGDFTDAVEAEEFVRRAGVAALAVMVGTAHGKYLKAPVLDIRRIREKIEITPKNPKYLKVVWGIGYKIEKID